MTQDEFERDVIDRLARIETKVDGNTNRLSSLERFRNRVLGLGGVGSIAAAFLAFGEQLGEMLKHG